jgi:NAD(P)-dependent dehydrogenase (short-subunit alcohol dehydrogenase family)
LVRALRVELAGHDVTAGVAYFGFIDTDMATQLLAQPHIQLACRALPGFVTDSISVQAGGRSVIDAIQRRASRASSPAWVARLLAFRSLSTDLMDEYMIHSSVFAQAIRDAEDSSVLHRAAAQPRSVADGRRHEGLSARVGASRHRGL